MREAVLRDGAQPEPGPEPRPEPGPGPGLDLAGATVLPGFLGRPAQEAMLGEVLAVMAAAPPVHPVTRRGRAMSVAMTAAGRFGWVSDRRGYRYEAAQADGRPWPPIPPTVLAVWEAVAPGTDPAARAPECCLVNLYRGARMGMHQDRDEAADDPVVSLSLGDACVFRIGNTENRGRPYTDLVLDSGDLVVFGRANRLAYHGVPRMVPSFAAEDIGLPEGRINITLRVSGLRD